MKTAAQLTPVIVRQIKAGHCKGQLTLLFPTIPADLKGRTCIAWDRLSGHGSADYQYMLTIAKIAPAQAAIEALLEYRQLYYTDQEGDALRLYLYRQPWMLRAYEQALAKFINSNAVELPWQTRSKRKA